MSFLNGLHPIENSFRSGVYGLRHIPADHPCRLRGILVLVSTAVRNSFRAGEHSSSSKMVLFHSTGQFRRETGQLTRPRGVPMTGQRELCRHRKRAMGLGGRDVFVSRSCAPVLGESAAWASGGAFHLPYTNATCYLFLDRHGHQSTTSSAFSTPGGLHNLSR